MNPQQIILDRPNVLFYATVFYFLFFLIDNFFFTNSINFIFGFSLHFSVPST
jgi:hypothetical protein